MSGFSAILGQPTAVETLTRAVAAGKLHHAYRFEGPRGVGKELAAFALAQALVCEAPTPLGCEKCSACQRAVTLAAEEPHVPAHPDVVLIGRGLYGALLGSGASEATGISVDQIRKVVLSRAGYRPHEGRALVFIVRDADELTQQAANALLKTLEEPADRTHFVLLTSRPRRLLDTVRSRTLAVRFGPLSTEIVAQLLVARGLSPEVAPLAHGSAELAFELADPEAMREREEFLAAARAALAAPDLAEAIALGKERAEGRDAIRDQLGFFAQALADDARSAIESDPASAEQSAHRHAVVLATLAEIERNVQPALALEAMVARLRRA
ncbi:MAG: DNA polymerase III subunit [Polyangiaceae bacterium]|nr:DNA polymerase III subunit [Polyangiaceae bacterium]